MARRCWPRRWPRSRTGVPRTREAVTLSHPLTPLTASQGLEHPGVTECVRFDVRQVQELRHPTVIRAAEFGVGLRGEVEFVDRLEAERAEERHLEGQHEQPVQAEMPCLSDDLLADRLAHPSSAGHRIGGDRADLPEILPEHVQR